MKPPFQILYSNDTVNVVSCTSRYHRAGDPFSEASLDGSVDETAGTGIDVHLLQPGLTMAPWWRSEQYPYPEHVRWYESTYQTSVRDNPYVGYMLGGGDMVAAFVRRCRAKGVLPMISLRLNDSHGKEYVNDPHGGTIAEIPGYSLHCVNRFYKDNPQFRIDPRYVDKAHWHTRVLNWTNPPVVKWMAGFIGEICAYDVGGVELDFMRHCNYFRPDEPLEERARIMTQFVASVRSMLDRRGPPGSRRWLGARMPAYLDLYDLLGLDIPALIGAGLDYITVSPYYYSNQQMDIGSIRRRAAGAAVYVEVTHAVAATGQKVAGTYDNFMFRRMTREQFYTTAHVAYARGADGFSAFNFAYYREHGAPGRGPFHEPPFDIFPRLRDRTWVSRQPQHYFIAAGMSWVAPFGRASVLPRKFTAGTRHAFALDLAPPAAGWVRGGRLRIQAGASLGATRWAATLNGAPLRETNDRSEPYPQDFNSPQVLGPDEERRAWVVPPELLHAGINTVELELLAGTAAPTIRYLDLGIA